MASKTYKKRLNYYYDIKSKPLIELVYRVVEEGVTLRLAIGNRRNRFLEHVDVKSLYLIVRENCGEDIYEVVDYRKYKAEKIGEEYVVDVKKVLNHLQLSYQELDGKEFQKSKKHEKSVVTDGVFRYGYRSLSHFWLDIDVYHVDICYLAKAFQIGATEIRTISASVIFDNGGAFQIIQESCKRKTAMDLETFKEFIEEAALLETCYIKWKHGQIKKTRNHTWEYEGRFEDGDIITTLEVDERKKHFATILYKCIQCREYEEFDNFMKKVDLLGL